ncbi:HEAT repeat domain-containing protein [Calothrix rhizosoleniae]|uniref:HEAT repeat domain-containing protein n=1 Tax=Calothrix rhizosoleniae TaxID=888997 RepID=UPI000B49DDA9|nr:HEAT repeat domain-containing protein [Calothrix rhizosoleniae]
MTQDTLFQQLKHPNHNLRDRAMWELAETRDENTIPRLMAIVGEEDVVYRRAAVKTLGTIGVDTVPYLVDSLLKNDNPTIRSSCAKALAQIAAKHSDIPFPEEGIQGLKISINDPHPVVNISSVMALGEIGAPAFDILVEAINTTDNVAIAVAGTNALVSMGDERVEEVLTNIANDESADTYVRETATSALSRLEMITKNQPK